MQFSFVGSAVRGTIVGVAFATIVTYPDLGLGEAVVDGVTVAVLSTLLLYSLGRTRCFLRRFAKRDAKPS